MRGLADNLIYAAVSELGLTESVNKCYFSTVNSGSDFNYSAFVTPSATIPPTPGGKQYIYSFGVFNFLPFITEHGSKAKNALCALW